MDVDLIERERSLRLKNLRTKKPTDQEREKRKKENLYYNYRKAGHRAKEYKSKAKELYVIEKTTGIEDQKADTSIIPQRKNWARIKVYNTDQPP